MPPRRYVCLLGAIVLAECALAFSFDVAVDPFGAFGWSLPHQGQRRTQASNDLRLVNPVIVDRLRPSAVILGSSTALTGLTFEHPGWPPGSAQHNLAIGGGTLREALWMLQYAQSANPVHRVVINLDFYTANMRYRDRMKRPIHELEDRIRRYAALTFSPHAFSSSVASLMSHGPVPYLDASGQQFIPIEWQLQQPGGVHGTFVRVERSYLSENAWFAGGDGFDFEGNGQDIFSVYRELLRYCHQHRIQLYLAVAPVHARFLSALRLAGLEPYFRYWETRLAQINQEEALHAGKPAFPLWDFAFVNALTSEPVPGAKDIAMKNFIDSNHFTPRLGRKVLDCLFGTARDGCSSYGAQLSTPQGVAEHLAHAAELQDAWELENPADLAEITRIACETQDFRAQLPPPGQETRALIAEFCNGTTVGSSRRNACHGLQAAAPAPVCSLGEPVR